jgi:hypothetical protein
MRGGSLYHGFARPLPHGIIRNSTAFGLMADAAKGRVAGREHALGVSRIAV